MSSSSSSTVRYILDSRENKLQVLFINAKVPFETKTLDLGDILIILTLEEGKEQTIVIERKSYTDLMSSIIDGRYREQKNRYLSLPSGTVYYIFENNDLKHDRLNSKQFWGSYVHTMIRDQIGVFLTQSIEETFDLIRNIATTIEKYGLGGKNVCSSNESQIRKKKLEKQEEIYKAQLCCFPGISEKKAQSIANVYHSMSSLENAVVNGSFTVKGIGTKLLENLKQGLIKKS